MPRRVLKTITSLLSIEPLKRRRAAAALVALQPTSSVAHTGSLPAFSLEETLDFLKTSNYPGMSAGSAGPGPEAPSSTIVESGHTLRIPLKQPTPASTRFLCITRLSGSHWTYFYEDPRPRTEGP